MNATTTTTIDMSKTFGGIALSDLAAQLDRTNELSVGAELSRGDLAKMMLRMMGKTPTWATYSEIRQAVVTTDDRSTTWNNGLKTAKPEGFIVPSDDSPTAVKKAAEREKADKAAAELIRTKFNGKRPDADTLREAAITKETCSKGDAKHAEAVAILRAKDWFDKQQQTVERELRAEVIELVKAAGVPHLAAALKVLKAALPEGATVEIKAPKAKAK